MRRWHRVLKAMEYLADVMGLSHGGLSAANCLLDENDRIKVVEQLALGPSCFSLSRLTSLAAASQVADVGMTAFRVAVGGDKCTGASGGGSALLLDTGGTVRCASPEALEDPSLALTEANDCFSFGCVCFETLEHAAPWAGLDDFQVLSRVFLKDERPTFDREGNNPDLQVECNRAAQRGAQ